MKALAFKELREVLGIALAALAAYLALVANLMGAKVFSWVPGIPSGTLAVPFAGSGFVEFFSIVSVLFAVALGFRQSAWESGRGTYLFLLHLPLSRNAIFLTKLATGVGLLAVCGGLPILLYAWWAAVPGHHAGPFWWSMTGPAWRLLFLTPLVYYGAFQSGLRPVRWLGTRLLPLFASVVLLLILDSLPWWWLAGFPAALLAHGLFVSNICFVARERDYA
jgi:hypothetical protein